MNAGSGGEPSSKSMVSFAAFAPVYKIKSATKIPAKPSIGNWKNLPTNAEPSTKAVAIQSVKLSAAEAFNALEEMSEAIFL